MQDKEYYAKYYQDNKERICKRTGAYNKTPAGRKVHKKSKDKFYCTPHGRARSLWHQAKSRAKDKGIEFTITVSFIEERIMCGCPLTGIPFELVTGNKSAYAPSVDKVDPSGGYTQDNCRVILWALNRFKGTGTDSDMLAIANSLVCHQEEV